MNWGAWVLGLSVGRLQATQCSAKRAPGRGTHCRFAHRRLRVPGHSTASSARACTTDPSRADSQCASEALGPPAGSDTQNPKNPKKLSVCVKHFFALHKTWPEFRKHYLMAAGRFHTDGVRVQGCAPGDTTACSSARIVPYAASPGGRRRPRRTNVPLHVEGCVRKIMYVRYRVPSLLSVQAGEVTPFYADGIGARESALF